MSKAVVSQPAQHAAESKPILGFWIYLMTDCVLFASLFATYVVLHNSTFGGPSTHEIINLPYILIETLLLLTSSFTCGLALLGARKNSRNQVLAWLAVTFVLGLSFLVMEITEFHHLFEEGNSWARSGFLSGFFTLVGTHGAHIATGLLWMSVVAAQVTRKGLNDSAVKRITLFSLFWHFLDIVWIFIFSVVYMMGSI